MQTGDLFSTSDGRENTDTEPVTLHEQKDTETKDVSLDIAPPSPRIAQTERVSVTLSSVEKQSKSEKRARRARLKESAQKSNKQLNKEDREAQESKEEEKEEHWFQKRGRKLQRLRMRTQMNIEGYSKEDVLELQLDTCEAVMEATPLSEEPALIVGAYCAPDPKVEPPEPSERRQANDTRTAVAALCCLLLCIGLV
eukprot:g70849.t1